MVPAKSSFVVETEVKGPLRVRLIDGTRNQNQFEHALTKDIEGSLRQRGVSVESMTFASTATEFLEALSKPGDFSCLLLVTHGEVSPPGAASPTRVEVGDQIVPWLLLAHVDANLKDKLVLLAVCGGYCSDAIWSLVHDGQLGLVLVGSEREVGRAEVMETFPDLLGYLGGRKRISPEAIESTRLALDRSKAFRVHSAVGLISGRGRLLECARLKMWQLFSRPRG